MVWKRSHTYLLGVYITIALISVLHYSTGTHAHFLHDIYRRLYYLPIILAAFINGWRGGLIAATIICIIYFPHAFWHIATDPASDTEKIMEMLLYIAVGLVTGYPVSRLKRSQQELVSSIEQLRSTETQLLMTAKLAAVGRLSAGLAHEVRNPLASIKGSAEILADDFPPGHRKHQMLRVLIDESERLNNVLARFLTFARPRKLEKKYFPIRPEIESVIALLGNQKEGQIVELYFPAVVGSGPEIFGDREQLRQVLLNVILNACQASSEGGKVWIECRTVDEMVRISIFDSGSGFSIEALENAFTPFFTTKDQGSGLGLAISHRIVELHGGRIHITNPEKGGGLVELEIPLRGDNV